MRDAVEHAAGFFGADATREDLVCEVVVPLALLTPIFAFKIRQRVCIQLAAMLRPQKRRLRAVFVGNPLPPLLEVERHAGRGALVAQRAPPVGVYRPRVRSAFAAADDPVDAEAAVALRAVAARAGNTADAART